MAPRLPERPGPAGCRSDDGEPADGEVEPPEPVELEIGDAIDLHTFAPRDIPAVVRAYLEAAQERGFSEVRLIHGKGKGVQRDRVRRIVAEHPAVAEHFDGTPGRGGWGATIARLHPPR